MNFSETSGIAVIIAVAIPTIALTYIANKFITNLFEYKNASKNEAVGDTAKKPFSIGEFLLENFPVISIAFIALACWTVVAAMGALSSSTPSQNEQFFQSLLGFIAAALISFVVTLFTNTRQNLRETEKLAKLAAERIAVQRSKILEVIIKTEGFKETNGNFQERFDFIAFELASLATDARASFNEINMLAKIDEATVEGIFEEAEEDRRKTQLRYNYQNIAPSCPSCDTAQKCKLTYAPSATAHITCENCNNRSIIHRYKETSSFKVISLTDVEKKELTYFYDEKSSLMKVEKNFRRDNNTLIEQQKFYHQAECPTDTCDNRISFPIPDNDEKAERYCYSCFSLIEYRKTDNSAISIEKIEKKTVEVANDQGRYICPHCQSETSPRIMKNKSNEFFSACKVCKKPSILLLKNRS